MQVIDPVAASYGVENALYAATQLAQTTMRSELGKISLDSVFAERCVFVCVCIRVCGGWGGLLGSPVHPYLPTGRTRTRAACRDTLNLNIVQSIQPAAAAWGLQVLR